MIKMVSFSLYSPIPAKGLPEILVLPSLPVKEDVILKADQKQGLLIPVYVLHSAEHMVILFLHELFPVFLSPKENPTSTLALFLVDGYDFCYERCEF